MASGAGCCFGGFLLSSVAWGSLSCPVRWERSCPAQRHRWDGWTGLPGEFDPARQNDGPGRSLACCVRQGSDTKGDAGVRKGEGRPHACVGQAREVRRATPPYSGAWPHPRPAKSHGWPRRFREELGRVGACKARVPFTQQRSLAASRGLRAQVRGFERGSLFWVGVAAAGQVRCRAAASRCPGARVGACRRDGVSPNSFEG
jgi:hypothetical protein